MFRKKLFHTFAKKSTEPYLGENSSRYILLHIKDNCTAEQIFFRIAIFVDVSVEFLLYYF